MAPEKAPTKKTTFREMPRKAQIYFLGLYLIGFSLLFWLILKGAINEKNWETALLFFFLSILIESYPLLVLEDGSSISAGFAVSLAAILVLGPYAAPLASAFGAFPMDLYRRRRPVYILFNLAMFTIMVFLAGLTYQALSFGRSYLDFLAVLPALLATILVLSFLNFGMFFLSLVFEKKVSLPEIWNKYYAFYGLTPFIYDLLFTPLGLFLVLAYEVSPWAITFFIFPFFLVNVTASLIKRLKRSEEQAIKDELTGLYNRRFFNEQLEITLSQAKREGKFLSLVILDLDNFKEFNDTYGHPEGDRALKELGEIILKTSRKSDIPVRYGGEEFALILPDTPRPGALLVAERLRKTVVEAKLSEESHPLTVSLGISTYPEDAKEASALLKEADQALYQAKKEGKNRTVAFERLVAVK